MGDINHPLIEAAEVLLEDIPSTEIVVEEKLVREQPMIHQDPHNIHSITPNEEGLVSPAMGHLVVQQPQSQHIQALSQAPTNLALPLEQPLPPTNASTFQKFGDIPTNLREEKGFDLYEIKKLNLAAAIEALERATQAHENFPSPDAGFSVASLSEQVLKLTKDIEKSQDPQAVHQLLMSEVMQPLAKDFIQTLAHEMKSLIADAKNYIAPGREKAFQDAFNAAVNRMGPAMKDLLETADIRLSKNLGIRKKG